MRDSIGSCVVEGDEDEEVDGLDVVAGAPARQGQHKALWVGGWGGERWILAVGGLNGPSAGGALGRRRDAGRERRAALAYLAGGAGRRGGRADRGGLRGRGGTDQRGDRAGAARRARGR